MKEIIHYEQNIAKIHPEHPQTGLKVRDFLFLGGGV